MELPKNITQIGESDRTCKVYVEDYVVSYMKQLSRSAEEKGPAIALYGKYTKEQNLSYFFIYGACQVLSITREVRHLSQAQNQEVERLRQRYFPEYEFLGYHIFEGDMVEGMHIQEQDACRYIKGYACFYEKNDSMLAYMVDNDPQDHEPEQYGQEKYDRARAKQEERRSQYGQKGRQTSGAAALSDRLKRRTEKQDPSMKMMRMSAVAVFAVLCLIGVAAVTRGNEGDTVGEQTGGFWAQLWDRQPQSEDALQEDGAQEATAEVYNSGTLMAESSLADAILQENQQVTAVSGQAVQTPPQTDVREEGPSPSPAPQETAASPSPQPSSETPLPQEPMDAEIPPQESLNPDSPENADPQEEVPAQGPSIAEIEAQQSQQQTQPVSYVIQAGDTLIGISTRQYGNDSYVQAICELNGIVDPDNIQIGQKILLP